MAWLPQGGKISKISLFILAQLTNVTDRRTDRQIDRHRVTAIAALCIASHGKNGTRWSYTYNGRLIVNCIWSIERCHILRPRTNVTPDFMVTPLLDAESLRNGTRYIQWNTNRDLHTFYSTVSFRMTLSDLEWLSEVYNDMKRRAVSLRYLSFLFWCGTCRNRRICQI